VTISAGGTIEQSWALGDSGHWYDLIVTVAERSGEETRLAGHVETGAPSITDPAAVTPVLLL
jgi:phospholipase C